MIGLTMGDPNGVGPEIILRAAAQGELGADYIVIGDFAIMEFANQHLGLNLPLHHINQVQSWQSGPVNILDLKLIQLEQLTVGRASQKAGFAAHGYIEYAVLLAKEQQLAALVTLPVNNEAVHLSDSEFTSQSELITKLCGVPELMTMIVSEHFTISYVTGNIPLADAIRALTPQRVQNAIQLTHNIMKRSLAAPRLAVAGLNPHAGEAGAAGREESTIIEPAIAKARQIGIDVTGPLAPETVFLKAVWKQFDAVVAMYHDQGFIPLKLLDSENYISVMLGLPFIYLSAGDDAGYGIAYQGKASTANLAQTMQHVRKLSGSQ